MIIYLFQILSFKFIVWKNIFINDDKDNDKNAIIGNLEIKSSQIFWRISKSSLPRRLSLAKIKSIYLREFLNSLFLMSISISVKTDSLIRESWELRS